MAEVEQPAVEEPKLLVGVPEADGLYEHLTKVLLKVIKTSQSDALANFESISHEVKAEASIVEATPDPQASEALVAAVTKQLHLIKAPKKEPKLNEEGEPEEEEEEEEKEQAVIPDILSDHKMLSAGGVQLDELTRYRMNLSIQKLATAKELQNVNFWGIINGIEKNYYVVEAKLEEYPEEEGAEENSPVEAMGSGANECIYFVTNEPEDEWTKLPAVKPHWIQSSRVMRRYLTGNLDATVMGFPRFPWKEAALLRAQIARISHSTTIAPKGVMTVDEEAEPEEQVPAENEEYTGLNPYKGNDPTNWTYLRPGLLKQGRCTPFVAEGEEEEEDEEELDEAALAAKAAKETEKEKSFPPLVTLNKERGVDDGSWKLSLSPSVQDPNCIACAESLQWPGAVAVASGKRVVRFYSGWGLDTLTDAYSPPRYPEFQPEYNIYDDPKKAPKEEGAPNPLNESEDVAPPAGWTPPEEVEEKGECDEGDDNDDEGKEGENEGDEAEA